MIDYLSPQCRPSTLDSYANVHLLLGAMQREFGKVKGEVLDVGCGRMPYKPLILSQQSRATRYIGLDIPNAAQTHLEVIRFDVNLLWGLGLGGGWGYVHSQGERGGAGGEAQDDQ